MSIEWITRRGFLGAMAASAIAIPDMPARAAAKYKRCIVTSPEGKRALAGRPNNQRTDP